MLLIPYYTTVFRGQSQNRWYKTAMSAAMLLNNILNLLASGIPFSTSRMRYSFVTLKARAFFFCCLEMSKQLTLFGTSAKDNKRAGNLIYKDPKSKYEKFIERFVRRNKGQASRESVVRSAQEKWKELRKDSAAVETYIAAKEGEEEILSLEESRLKSSHDENPKKNADVQRMC